MDLARFAAWFVVVILCIPPAPASARPKKDDPFSGVEEMIVVGEGTARVFQHDEVSAIAFDSDYLEAIGASDISDIAAFTPNLEIRTPFAASNPTLFIRGVGLRDFTAASSSSVAIYNDEIYMNSPAGQLAQLFDIQSIDVLRGPQATIYGRNSSAGTIRVITRKPTGTPGASGSVTYGRFNQLDFNVAVENVIIDERLSMRTAAKWSQRDGLTKNRCADSDYTVRPPARESNGRTRQTQQNALVFSVYRNCFDPVNIFPPNSPPGNGWTEGETAPVKEWVNDTKNWAARTILRFQHPYLDMDWQLNIHGGQNRGDARQFQMIAASQSPVEKWPSPTASGVDVDNYRDGDNRLWTRHNQWRPILNPSQGNPYEGDYDNIEKEKVDLFGGSLVGELNFGDYTLKTITGYEWNKRDTQINLDGNPFPSLQPALSNKSYQVTQELRLDFDGGDGFTWQLGGMYLYEALEAENFFTFSLAFPEVAQSFSFFTRYGSVWYAADWEPSETFSLRAGIRVNYEDKEIDLQHSRSRVAYGTGLRIPLTFPASHPLAGQPIPERTASSTAKAYGWAGDLIATYSPATDFNFYIRYARGWKGPHINSGVVNPGADDSDGAKLTEPASPELIDSVEAGLNATFWGDRITLSGAAFYYDYQDIQIYALKNAQGAVPIQELINADDADILGVELELDIKPFEGWAHPVMERLWIHAAFAWLDSKYTDFVNVFETQGGETTVVKTTTEDFTGNRLINSPEFAFAGFVAWPVGGEWGVLIPRFDWSFKDKVYFSPANSAMVAQHSLWMMNLRLTYKSPSQAFELSGWIENLTNQAYTQDVLNLARLRRAILHAIGDPRTYGLTLTMYF